MSEADLFFTGMLTAFAEAGRAQQPDIRRARVRAQRRNRRVRRPHQVQ
jgi:hypothetical protein